MIQFKRIVLPWVPALIIMGVIFGLSSLHGDQIHLPGFRFSDKVAHVIAYAVLGWSISLRLVLRGSPSALALAVSGETGPSMRPLPMAFDKPGVIVGILYGASDEIHQMFVPLRESGVDDWAADALGICLGTWICLRMFRKFLAGRQASL